MADAKAPMVLIVEGRFYEDGAAHQLDGYGLSVVERRPIPLP